MIEFPLLLVHMDITEKCNLSCNHCRDTFRIRRGVQLTDHEILQACDKVHKASNGSLQWLSIGGGEPLLRDRTVLAVIQRCRKLGVKTLLTTNGILLTNVLADTLIEEGLSRVQISLDGATAKTNDAQRGVGSYDSALTAISNALTSGLETTVRMTITAENIHEAEDFVKLMSSLKVDAIGMRRAIPVGKASFKMIEGWTKDYQNLLHRLPKLEKKYGISIFSGDPLALIANTKLLKSLTLDTYGGCSAGLAYIYISPEGYICPCPSLRDIEITNISAVGWYKQLRKHPFVNRIATRDAEGCKECKYRLVCGGCRVLAKVYYGDYFGRTPDCWIGEMR